MDGIVIESWQDPAAPGKHGVKLSGSMTIGQVAGIKEALLAALGAACELQVDLTGISEIDLTGLQLLDAAHKSSLSSGKQFRVVAGGNRSYLDAVESAGLRRLVGCGLDKGCSCIWVGEGC